MTRKPRRVGFACVVAVASSVMGGVAPASSQGSGAEGDVAPAAATAPPGYLTFDLVSFGLGRDGKRVPGDNNSFDPAVAGCSVAFASNAANLADADEADSDTDVFLYAPAGGPVPMVVGPGAHSPDMTPNGAVVAFTDVALPGPGHGPVGAVYLSQGGRRTRVTPVEDVEGNGPVGAGQPSLSADASVVAFQSRNRLVEADGDAHDDIYVVDVASGAHMLVSTGAADTVVGNRSPAISADGTQVTFISRSDDKVDRVFVRDLVRSTPTQVSVATDGTPAAEGPDLLLEPAISATGRFVAFESKAANLVPGDTNGAFDVFVRDRDTDGDGVFDEPGAVVTTRVSVSTDGVQGNANSRDPSISAEGRWVAFTSLADNLDPTDPDRFKRVDVYVHDRDADADGVFDEPGAIGTALVRTSSGDEPNRTLFALDPDISQDGATVAFASGATNLHPDAATADPQRHQIFLAVRAGEAGRCGLDNAALRGTIVDGHPLHDGHANPLHGARVDLRKGGEVVHGPVATGESGRYQFANVAPGSYRLRVTLEDALREPPFFDVRHMTGGAAWIEVDLTVPAGAKLVNRNVGFTRFEELARFTSAVESGERSRLADMANIFYRTQQFASWAELQLGATLTTPSLPPPLEIVTFSPLTRGAHYCQGTGNKCPAPTSIHISARQSLFERREHASAPGPENVEWHEVAHHLHAVNVSPAGCPGRNHAGYANASTCDSMDEAVAELLPTLAWGDIAGVPDSDYGGFGSLESNGWKAWTSHRDAAGGRLEREEFAIAAMLWDLIDANADSERTQVRGADNTHTDVTYTDTIAVPLTRLWRVLARNAITSVGDLRPALFNEDAIPADLKAIRIDLDGDGVDDVEPLDIPFLMHGFYPIPEHEASPASHRYDVLVADRLNFPGSRRNRAVGRTDSFPPSSGPFRTPRNAAVETPGAFVRVSVQNPKGRPVRNGSALVTVRYPELTTVREVALDGATDDVHLEVPPYYSGPLPDGERLPACDQASVVYPVEVEVRAVFAGSTSVKRLGFDNCEYLQAVAESAGQYAMRATFTVPRARTATTLRVARKNRIVARGRLTPAHPGERMAVKLQRRRDGHWRTVVGKRPVLRREIERADGAFSSAYRARFRRPSSGRCRLVARWRGDNDHRPSVQRRAFRC